MQPVSGDASVFVEFDFDHGGDGASMWVTLVCCAECFGGQWEVDHGRESRRNRGESEGSIGRQQVSPRGAGPKPHRG